MTRTQSGLEEPSRLLQRALDHAADHLATLGYRELARGLPGCDLLAASVHRLVACRVLAVRELEHGEEQRDPPDQQATRRAVAAWLAGRADIPWCELAFELACVRLHPSGHTPRWSWCPIRTEGRGPVALRGDEERLFTEQRERLVSIVRFDTGAPTALVEDGVSHAFEQLCHHQPKRDRVVGWLRVVARHEVSRLLRNCAASRSPKTFSGARAMAFRASPSRSPIWSATRTRSSS